MAPHAKLDAVTPTRLLTSAEISAALKTRFLNAARAATAMPQFARSLVYKVYEGEGDLRESTLRRFTDALSAYDRDSDNGPTPVAAPQGPALAARHPGDADLTIDTNDGDAIAEESA